MSTKVAYIVTADSYENYHIAGVYTSREDADARRQRMDVANHTGYARVEEWPLDPPSDHEAYPA